MANPRSGCSAAGRMARAARAFIDGLAPDQRQTACATFDAPDRREFTYLPGPRPGLALDEMTDEQQARAMELLATGLSERGMANARTIMQLEGILAEIERAVGRRGWQRRHPRYYWFRILGYPDGSGPWAWKAGGHHLAVHMTIVGEQVAGTPQFFGANPAVVPDGHAHAGLRTLADEEDLGRALVTALTPAQRELAVSAPLAPRDIITRSDPVADVTQIPSGLIGDHMSGEQRELLVRLIRRYLGRVIPAVADTAWEEIDDAGLERVSFRWAGPTDPGHGHYYAVLGPTFLIEYDNTQNNANHIHTVWRDLRHDWGDDLLAAHYASPISADHEH
ncbi:DUF3500 domain-containing protein [Actinobacteria bacterium YIM 96077]|uniref:DUF3500 domain-containing protein n=1 Tax=Phytoactinopolyspora halophila TaxID=1981511 RepID=A0A329QZK3_9ACTN|nr:DUF3500 domain-containing protein [Phytoactinopolyspora halophila]AYY11736.1 DUF3500 domain-containing protein [Actinobacteria bacterium YIM 96077]RAW17830.1 hypothetical protein DPM12_02940 [Phytoactinopolyspora halophila]